MLPKRLRLQSEFIPPLAKHGKYVKGEYFNLAYSKDGSDKDEVLFGISISRGVDKRATVRNRIKRRLRAAILRLSNEMDIPTGRYLIIVRSAKLRNKAVNVNNLLKKSISQINSK